MQYISPLSLLDIADTGRADRKSIMLAKKKMLAELELNGGGSVFLKGRDLTKNDIIIFFDNLLQAGDLYYHTAIAGDGILLRFLEHNTLGRKDRFKNTELYSNLDFIEWVSPYFFTSFSFLAKKCLAKKMDDEWCALLANPLLMNDYYTEASWKAIESIIRVNLESLQGFCNRKGALGWEFIEPLVNFRYISMLKYLPENRFAWLMDEYAFVTMQCSVYVFNKISRSRGIIIVENALLLVVSEHARTQIMAKHAEMDRLEQAQRRSSPRKLSRDWWAIIGILAIFLRVTFEDTEVSPNSKNNPPVFTNAPVDTELDYSPPQRIKKIQGGDTLKIDSIEPPPPEEPLPAAAPSKKSGRPH